MDKRDTLGGHDERDAHSQAGCASKQACVACSFDRIVGECCNQPFGEDLEAAEDDAEKDIEDEALGEDGIGPVLGKRLILRLVNVVLDDKGRETGARGEDDDSKKAPGSVAPVTAFLDPRRVQEEGQKVWKEDLERLVEDVVERSSPQVEYKCCK